MTKMTNLFGVKNVGKVGVMKDEKAAGSGVMSDDDDGKRWNLPPEDQWVEVQFLGVAKLFCIHKISGLPVWKTSDGWIGVVGGIWWRKLPGEGGGKIWAP